MPAFADSADWSSAHRPPHVDGGYVRPLVKRTRITASVRGGELHGWVAGEGPRILLLHGGPVGYAYLDLLAAELVPRFTVAAYQQRGIAPSTSLGPFDMETQAMDAGAVLDALSWDRTYVLGHSLGGYYALQLARRIPQRVRGALIVDPLGAVGDGGMAEFWATQLSRLTSDGRRRMRELEALQSDGGLTPSQAAEADTLIWPTYFARSDQTFPFVLTKNAATHDAVQAAVFDDMAALEAWLPESTIPMRFVHGADSPMPLSASTDTMDLLPNAALEVVDGAGHFIWFERPGAVTAALERLINQTEDTADPGR